MRTKISVILVFSVLVALSIFPIPKPILYISFNSTFEPDIMNTKFTFEPRPKLFGNPRIVREDGNDVLYLDGRSFLRYKATDLLDYENFTVSIWIKPKKIGSFDRNNWHNMTALFHLRDYHDYMSEWGISVYRSYPYYYLFTMYPVRNAYQGWYYEFEKDLLDGKWHHVVFIRNGNSLVMYLDGEKLGQIQLKLDQRPTNFRSYYLYIGAAKRVGTRGKFRGYMDDIAVWNVALTHSDVMNMYKNGGIGKEEVKSYEIDIEKAKAKLREAYNSGKITNEQLKRALNELMSGNISRLLRDFILGVISVDDFAVLY